MHYFLLNLLHLFLLNLLYLFRRRRLLEIHHLLLYAFRHHSLWYHLLDLSLHFFGGQSLGHHPIFAFRSARLSAFFRVALTVGLALFGSTATARSAKSIRHSHSLPAFNSAGTHSLRRPHLIFHCLKALLHFIPYFAAGHTGAGFYFFNCFTAER